MDIYDYAIQMERRGYDFYIKSAATLKDKAARRMLSELAEDEKGHERLLQDAKRGEKVSVETNLTQGVKDVFQELAAGNKTFIGDEDNLSNILRKGVEMEDRSVELYHGFLEKADSPDEKRLWKDLQTIEEKHLELLSLTLEYIDQPNIVLENAEFLFYDHEEAP